MTNYIESIGNISFILKDYTEYRSIILHQNIPDNYKKHHEQIENYKKFTYIYQICWSIKFLRSELTHVLK